MLQRHLDLTSMAEKAALNPEPPRRRRGRPSRKEEVQRALTELGVDPSLINPRRVLAAIAGDTSAPAGARVAACKALLNLDPAAEDSTPGMRASGGNAISQRALVLLDAARRKGH
jgi:hypothetical protein